MRMRVVSVVAALAVMAGLPFAVAKLLPHRPPPSTELAGTVHTAQVKRYPQQYVGVVSNDLAAFDRSCKCRPNAAIHYLRMGGPVSMSLAKLALEARAVPVLELEPFGIPVQRSRRGPDQMGVDHEPRVSARGAAAAALAWAVLREHARHRRLLQEPGG